MLVTPSPESFALLQNNKEAEVAAFISLIFLACYLIQFCFFFHMPPHTCEKKFYLAIHKTVQAGL